MFRKHLQIANSLVSHKFSPGRTRIHTDAVKRISRQENAWLVEEHLLGRLQPALVAELILRNSHTVAKERRDARRGLNPHGPLKMLSCPQDQFTVVPLTHFRVSHAAQENATEDVARRSTNARKHA